MPKTEDADFFESKPKTLDMVPINASPISNEAERLLKQAINVNSKKVFLEPSCPICTSSSRVEIEDKIMANPHNTKEISKYIKESFNLEISSDLVQNHFENHLQKRAQEIQKLEYASKIGRMNSSVSTIEQIEILSNVLIERIVSANSLSSSAGDTMDVEESKSKQTAQLISQFRAILKMKADLLGEMKSTGEVVSIPKDAFVEIFKKAILEVSKTDGERKIVQFISESLQKSCQS